MVEARLAEAVICSALELVEKTEVCLIGGNSTEYGVVLSCRPCGGKFIVTILINSQTSHAPDPDPGVLLIDSFMTEEQEKRILDEIESEIQGQQFRSLAAAREYLNSSCVEGTAALNRLLKFTVRSSTALVSTGFVQVWDKFRQAAGTCTLVRAQTNADPSQCAGRLSTCLPAPQAYGLPCRKIPIQ